jgi:riboflavin synthase
VTAVFTGIIGEIGRVTGVVHDRGGVHLTVEAASAAAELHVNDSVSLNGACQTVISTSTRAFTVQAVEETLSKTTLGEFVPGTELNIELPLRLNDRLGGHMVLGHVDCVGAVSGIDPRESSTMFRISYPEQFGRYVIQVGSIAVDGISLTVASTASGEFAVSVIPHTLSKTTLSRARKGMHVNLEFDVIGKYVEKLVTSDRNGNATGSLTSEKLRSWGYNI